MNDSDALLNLLFGWGFVVITVLLIFILLVVLRSMFAFKNAKKIKGKIIELTSIGELNLPTVECSSEGETVRFKTKTPLSNLAVGQAIDVEISSLNEPRIFDANRPEHAPKILFMIIILLTYFCVKGFTFLLTLFA